MKLFFLIKGTKCKNSQSRVVRVAFPIILLFIFSAMTFILKNIINQQGKSGQQKLFTEQKVQAAEISFKNAYAQQNNCRVYSTDLTRGSVVVENCGSQQFILETYTKNMPPGTTDEQCIGTSENLTTRYVGNGVYTPSGSCGQCVQIDIGDQGTTIYTGDCPTPTRVPTSTNIPTQIPTRTPTPTRVPPTPTKNPPVACNGPCMYNNQCATGLNCVNQKMSTKITQFTFGSTASVPVVGNYLDTKSDTIATFQNGLWSFRKPDNTVLSTLRFGLAGDTPIMCDWDGNGSRTPGVIRKTTNAHVLHFTNTLYGSAISGSFRFGNSQINYIPLCGDWDGDKRETLGIFDPNTATFTLSNATNNTFSPDITITFGIPGDLPVAGDWNGDGKTGIGVFRKKSTTTNNYMHFYLRNELNVSNLNTATDFNDDLAQFSEFQFGLVGDTPIAGDWNRIGKDQVGVKRGATYILREETIYGGVCRNPICPVSASCACPTPTQTPTTTSRPTNTPTVKFTNTPTRANTPTTTSRPTNTPTVKFTNTPTRANTPTPTPRIICEGVTCRYLPETDGNYGKISCQIVPAPENILNTNTVVYEGYCDINNQYKGNLGRVDLVSGNPAHFFLPFTPTKPGSYVCSVRYCATDKVTGNTRCTAWTNSPVSP